MPSLAQLSPARYDDPLARIDWRFIDRECWWLPPTALSLCGVPEFEALPLDARRRLSHAEYAHLLQAGLWLESLFMARLASLAHRSADPARRTRFLHELREEAGHSLMFVELLERSGFGVRAPGAGTRFLNALGQLLPGGSALFWAIVVAAEELPDRLNRRLKRAVDDVTLSAVVYRMAQIHTRDEAVHAAFARTQCEQAAARSPAWLRALLAVPLSASIGLYARYVYFPPAWVYERAGLVPARRWRARALANQVRRAQVHDMLRPTLEFLRRSGWRV